MAITRASKDCTQVGILNKEKEKSSEGHFRLPLSASKRCFKFDQKKDCRLNEGLQFNNGNFFWQQHSDVEKAGDDCTLRWEASRQTISAPVQQPFPIPPGNSCCLTAKLPIQTKVEK